MATIYKYKSKGCVAVCAVGIPTVFFVENKYETNSPKIAKVLDEHPMNGIDFWRVEPVLKKADSDDKQS